VFKTFQREVAGIGESALNLWQKRVLWVHLNEYAAKNALKVADENGINVFSNIDFKFLPLNTTAKS
jgi:hypothetical protein